MGDIERAAEMERADLGSILEIEPTGVVRACTRVRARAHTHTHTHTRCGR